MSSDSKPDIPKLDSLVCFQAYALDRAFSRFYQAAFGDSGFTYPKYVILLALHENGPMSVGKLSSRVGVETNSISPLLKRMAAHGIIERVRSVEDERRVDVSITPFGTTVVETVSAGMADSYEVLDVQGDAVRQAIETLSALRTALDGATPPKIDFPTPPSDAS